MKYSLNELGSKFGASLRGDGTFQVEGVSDVRVASERQLCFITSDEYLPYLAASQSKAFLVAPSLYDGLNANLKTSKNYLLTPNPYAAFIQIVMLFHPTPTARPGRHSQSFVHVEAEVHASAEVGPFVSIDRGAKVGAGVILHAGVWIGEGAEVGDGTILFGGAKIYPFCKVGKRNIIHGGAVIGADGFGFIKHEGRNVKIPQVGRVILGDDVEVGANSCIDRGTLDDTVIGDSTKIDNLVQIGHNCKIGKNGILCAFVGLGGNTTCGDNVTFGGQAASAGHLTVGDNTQVAGQSGVSKDIPANSAVKGYPPRPLREYLKNQALFLKLPEIYRRLVELEKRSEEPK